jgi:hypothetical protein
MAPHFFLTYAVIQVAGEPLDQPVVQYGPFVMTSVEEIQKTFIDCEHLVALCKKSTDNMSDRSTRTERLRKIAIVEERDRRSMNEGHIVRSCSISDI